MFHFNVDTPKGFKLWNGYWLKEGATEEQFNEAVNILKYIFVKDIIVIDKEYILVIGIELYEG